MSGLKSCTAYETIRTLLPLLNVGKVVWVTGGGKECEEEEEEEEEEIVEEVVERD